MTLADERRLARLEQQMAEATLDASAHPKVDRPTPLEFIETLKIVDRESGKIVPFKLWKAQKEMLRAFIAEDRLVVVKARQLGCSYLSAAYMLYLATFEPGQLFLVARQSLEEASEAITRLRVMNASVPERWRQRALTDNVNSLAFANGSRIRALSSTKRLGRGLSARYVIADEIAWWDAPETQLAALEPGAQRLHVISTGAGPHDFFHRLYLDALTGQGRWRQRFYSWDCHPGRTGDWHHVNVDLAPSPALARREYAATPEDAFTSPAGRYWERFTTRNVAEVDVVPAWTTVRGVDFGYRNASCVWANQSPAGQLFVVSELCPKNTTSSEFASQILARDRKLGVTPVATYVDPAGAAKNVQTAQSEVEIFKSMGLNPRSRASGVRDGCVRLTEMLSDEVLPLIISTACPWLIEAFSTMRPDRNSPEVPDEGSDYAHVMDSLRYMVVNLRGGRLSGTPGRTGIVVGHASPRRDGFGNYFGSRRISF